MPLFISIVSIFKIYISGTLIGLFSQIRTGGDIVRDRALRFLLMKIKTEGTELFNKEAENHLLEEIKLCMGEVIYYIIISLNLKCDGSIVCTIAFITSLHFINCKGMYCGRVSYIYDYSWNIGHIVHTLTNRRYKVKCSICKMNNRIKICFKT